MEIHQKKVFENAFQIQILSKYTSLNCLLQCAMCVVTVIIKRSFLAELDHCSRLLLKHFFKFF